MKKIIAIGLMLVFVFSFAACTGTDVIAKFSGPSLSEVIKNLPESVKADDSKNGWVLTSPTGEKFIWSKDFSSAGMPDLAMEFDSKPFIDAGLKPELLDAKTYAINKDTNKLSIQAEIGNEVFKNDVATQPIDTFNEIVKTHRSIIGYHEKLDHYGIAFGGGNMFEWAKDVKTNDKDMVFVLNPQPFIDAGVDPAKVSGWIFAKVEIKNDKGQKELVDKLLKPFNLK